MLGEAAGGVGDAPRGHASPLDACKGTRHPITPPKFGGMSAFPSGPLPFLRGLLYHRSFLMSGMVILAVGLSVRILCSKAGGDGEGNGNRRRGIGCRRVRVAYLRAPSRSFSKAGGRFSSPSSRCIPGSYRWAGPRAALPEEKTRCVIAPAQREDGKGGHAAREAAQHDLHRDFLQGEGNKEQSCVILKGDDVQRCAA